MRVEVNFALVLHAAVSFRIQFEAPL